MGAGAWGFMVAMLTDAPAACRAYAETLPRVPSRRHALPNLVDADEFVERIEYEARRARADAVTRRMARGEIAPCRAVAGPSRACPDGSSSDAA
jgi:hypothetical protein